MEPDTITKTALSPLHTNVLVLLDSRQATSKGGIAIPMRAQRAEEWGTVIAIGNKCEHLNEGDRAYVPPHLGTHYIERGQDYIIIPEDKVVAREMRKGESIKREFRDNNGYVVGVRYTYADHSVTEHGECPAQ